MRFKVVYETGFTLIEAIIGIVVLSIAFSIMVNLIYPRVEESADQLHQVRAAELAQSLLNEIQGRAFDENSDKVGSIVRCGELGAPACTTSIGNEEGGTRELFDDVDDYHNLALEDSEGEDLSGVYKGFSIQVSVINDSNYDGVADTLSYSTAKLITVSVTTPQGFTLDFSAYKVNF
jgi:MSHA pilin protein MshD